MCPPLNSNSFSLSHLLSRVRKSSSVRHCATWSSPSPDFNQPDGCFRRSREATRRRGSARVPLTEHFSVEELAGDGAVERRGEEERGGASGTSLNVSTENPAGFPFLSFFFFTSPTLRSTPAPARLLIPPTEQSTLSGSHLVSTQETRGGWRGMGDEWRVYPLPRERIM